MARYFISDTHFNDDRFNLFYRPFKTVEEQDEFLIEKWNSVVSENDEVYHIGDFTTKDEGLQLSGRLNGKIHLIRGNYDEPRNQDDLRDIFESVSDEMVLTLSNGREVYLNHYPSKCVSDMFNLTGHIHGLWKVQRNMINVSCDAWHFTPVSEDQIIFAINAIENFYDENVFAGELSSNIDTIYGNEIYATDEIPKIGEKLFLAGPTPRSINVDSWRPEMIKSLRESGYKGHILIPEKKNREDGYDYDSQVEWEDEALTNCDLILFWVPRNLDNMPGFTTNIEWGQYMNSGKVVLGYPKDAPGMRYMHKKADKYDVSVFHDINSLSEFVVEWFYG